MSDDSPVPKNFLTQLSWAATVRSGHIAEKAAAQRTLALAAQLYLVTGTEVTLEELYQLWRSQGPIDPWTRHE